MSSFRALGALVIGAACWGAVLVTGPARAQSTQADMDRLVQNLSKPDFRVRTQAALALGASGNVRAVAPLCESLADQNTTVRAASAAAIGRLSLGGNECLRRRYAAETSEVVKAAIETALVLIATGGAAEPTFSSSSRFYICLGKTADKTGRKGPDVDVLVRGAMAQKARATAGFVVAPVTESVADAKRRLASHPQIKPFLLSPGVNPPDYSNGNLTIKIEIAMLSYPEKNLIGSYSVKLTEPGVSQPSPQNEDELIRMAAERAVDKFVGVSAQF